MFTVSDATWVAVGTYNWLQNLSAVKKEQNLTDRFNAIIAALTDKELESKMREMVCNVVTNEEFNNLWTYIESFKRENPHIVSRFDDYWGYVGKQRFPFTYSKYCEVCNKRRLTKAEEKMLSTYRGWVVSLLMNTHGKYSEMAATRIATPIVYGPNMNASWTREFG